MDEHRRVSEPEVDPHPTGALVPLAREGDQLAWSVLCQHLQPGLDRRVRRHRLMPVLAVRHAPQDIISMVWLRFLGAEGLDRFRDEGPGSLLRYLGAFVDHVMGDLVRRDTTQKNGGGRRDLTIGSAEHTGDLAIDPPAGDPTPSHDAQWAEVLAVAKERLSETEFRVWWMKVVERRTSFEIGEVLNMSASTVRNASARAVTALARALRSLRGDA